MNVSIKVVIVLIIQVMIFNSSVASTKGVAKIIILKGDIKASQPGEEPSSLKKGDWLKEGVIITSAKRSFAKLLFIDKSQMTLGPTSEMLISKFPKKKAGIISLLKGQLRAKITKDYMQMKDKSKSKLFIKTKSAAMGIRGTDFQVVYTPETNATSLITFSGAVAMVNMDDSADFRNNNQRNLDKMLNTKDAVLVRKGEFSSAGNKKERVSRPVKISPKQLNILKQNENMIQKEEKKEMVDVKKRVRRNPIPPMVDAKVFSNTSQLIDTTKIEAPLLNSVIDGEVAPKVSEVDGIVAPINAPIIRAGGAIDLTTGEYIPPVETARYDEVAQVYIDDKLNINQDGTGLTEISSDLIIEGTQLLPLADGPIVTDGRYPATTTGVVPLDPYVAVPLDSYNYDLDIEDNNDYMDATDVAEGVYDPVDNTTTPSIDPNSKIPVNIGVNIQ